MVPIVLAGHPTLLVPIVPIVPGQPPDVVGADRADSTGQPPDVVGADGADRADVSLPSRGDSTPAARQPEGEQSAPSYPSAPRESSDVTHGEQQRWRDAIGRCREPGISVTFPDGETVSSEQWGPDGRTEE